MVYVYWQGGGGELPAKPGGQGAGLREGDCSWEVQPEEVSNTSPHPGTSFNS